MCRKCAAAFLLVVNSSTFLLPISSEIVIHRRGALAFLAVLANIKMTLKLTEFLKHHLRSRLRAEEETAARHLLT